MKKIAIIMLAFIAVAITSKAQATYNVISECDTTVKAKLNSLSLGSRDVHHIIYEYPSTDADGQPVTISGVIMIPQNILDGSVPVTASSCTIISPSVRPRMLRQRAAKDLPPSVLCSPTH